MMRDLLFTKRTSCKLEADWEQQFSSPLSNSFKQFEPVVDLSEEFT